jgi:hypothetical protein
MHAIAGIVAVDTRMILKCCGLFGRVHADNPYGAPDAGAP